MSIEPWSIERSSVSYGSGVESRVVSRLLTDAEGRRWSCRKIAELLIADTTPAVRQVVACAPDDGGTPVHIRVVGDWSVCPDPELLEAIGRARIRRDD